MGFFKRYAALLVPVGIAVLAFLFFIPTSLMSKSIQKQMDSIVLMAGTIESLKRKAVPANQWKVERQYQAKHGSDANTIATLAKQSSQRELLSYKIFPEPKSSSVQIFREFGANYISAIDALVRRLNALDCPTAREIEILLHGPSKKGILTSQRSASYSRGRGGKSSEGNDEIIESFCSKRAESIPVYTNPAAFSGYEFWKDFTYDVGTETMVTYCWYGQLAYWIQKDIVDTISVLNAGSDCVYTSAVKHLLGVNFSNQQRGAQASEIDSPQYVDFEGAGLEACWTKRLCNEDVDIVHFSVSVIVSSRAVLPFMRELCSEKTHKFAGYDGRGEVEKFKHNQITILRSNISPIDRESVFKTNYRYGNDAIVELNLVCEYIFNRAGYDVIKPKSIKIDLGQWEEKDTKDQRMQRGSGRREQSKTSSRVRRPQPDF